MLYAVVCECANGHNIVGAARDDGGRELTVRECEEACRMLEGVMVREMRAGRLERECPHCGSEYGAGWPIRILRVRPESGIRTFADMQRMMEGAAEEGMAAALEALGRRRMAGKVQ